MHKQSRPVKRFVFGIFKGLKTKIEIRRIGNPGLLNFEIRKSFEVLEWTLENFQLNECSMNTQIQNVRDL